MPPEMLPPQPPMPAPDAGMPPPPASPPEAGMPLPPPGSAAAPGEMPLPFDPEAAKAELQGEFEGLQAKEDELTKAKELSEQDLTGMKQTIIKDLFEMMKKAGVDPSDVESISNFMNQLQEQDPDLYELFDFAFSNLTGQPSEMAPPEMMPPGMDPELGPLGMTPPAPEGEAMPPEGGMPPMPGMEAPLPPPSGGVGMPPAGPAGPKDFGNLMSAMGQ